MSRNKIQRIIPARTLCVKRAAAPAPGFPGFMTRYYADGTCALNAPTAQHAADGKKMLKVNGSPLRTGDRQANCFRVPVLSRETPGECRNLWGVRYRTGGNLCKKRHSMQICKYGDSEAIRDANFPRVELCAGRTCYTKL